MIDKISSDMLLKQMEQLQKSINTNEDKAPDGVQSENDFKNLLGKLIDDVDVAQKEADMSIKNLATGEQPTSIQDVVVKMEQANISFMMMKEIRDKLLQAYKDVMSMQ